MLPISIKNKLTRFVAVLGSFNVEKGKTMEIKTSLLTLISSILLLTSCNSPQSPSNSSSSSEQASTETISTTESNSTSSSEIDKRSPLEIAIENTEKNYEFETEYHEIDNINSNLNHYSYKNIRYDGSNSIYWSKYTNYYGEDRQGLLDAKENIDTYYQTVFYYDENGNLAERFKREDDVWKQFNYTPSFTFKEKITDYLIPEHFELKDDGFYYLKDEYLGGEESALIGGYYGSLAYLTQDFDYLAVSIKDGKLDQYKHSVHFSEYNNSNLTYDATVVMSGTFSNIGEISLTVPELPVYPEDLLPTPEKLEKAKTATENNYTYTEKYVITDEDNNQKEFDYIEQVNDRSFRYYAYSDYAECYYDEYTYDVKKENFSGNISSTSYVTSLYYYDDHTEYYSSDAGTLDDSISRVAAMGSSFGTKSYIYNEEGNYYEPRLEKPERYNPNDFTYLDYDCRSFIHGVIGNYTTADGLTYHYDFEYLRFYLTENNTLAKATYKYTLTKTKDNISNVYVITGEGNFTNIGTTTIAVPSNPNDDIKIDSRLEGLYNSINLDNYTYEETYEVLNENNEPIDLFGVKGQPVYQAKNTESRNGRYVCEGAYGHVPKVDNEEEYDVEFVDQYFYYDEYRVIQTYKLKNYEQLYFSIPGTYTFSPCINALKQYLKYFTFVRNKTVDGKEASIFALKNTYLKFYGTEFLKSLSPNDAVNFSSMNLTVIGNEVNKITYEYDLYKNGNKLGVASGTIKIGNFGTTEVNMPNFDPANFKVTALDDTVKELNKYNYHTKIETQVSYFSKRSICKLTTIDDKNPTLVNKENEAYHLDENGSLYADIDVEGNINKIKVMDLPSVDINQIKQSDFRCDSSGDFVLKEENRESFFENVLGVYKDHPKEDVNPGNVSINASTSNGMVITLNYVLRYKGSDGKYITFYVNQTISISVLPFME